MLRDRKAKLIISSQSLLGNFNSDIIEVSPYRVCTFHFIWTTSSVVGEIKVSSSLDRVNWDPLEDAEGDITIDIDGSSGNEVFHIHKCDVLNALRIEWEHISGDTASTLDVYQTSIRLFQP